MFSKLLGVGLVSGLLFGYAGAINAASPTVYGWSGIKVIPTEYTENHAPMVYSYSSMSQGDSRSYEFFVFDENFKEIKNFRTIPMPEAVTVSKVQEREYTYRDVYCNYVNQIGGMIYIDGENTGISEEKALEWVRSNYGRGEVAKLLDGKTCIAYDFWNEYQVGAQYPSRYYALNPDNVWCEYEAQYSGDWGPYGDWGEVREETYSNSVYPGRFDIITPDGGDTGAIYLTQTLFGNSGSFNYLLPLLGTTTVSGEDEYRKWTEQRAVTKGIRVMSDNNEEVTTFDIPSGYYVSDGEIYMAILTMNGKTYAIVDVRKENVADGENEDYSVVYALSEQSGLPSQIAITPSTSVSPRTPMRGERVTVTLGEKASANGCDVKVVSTSGQTVMQTRVAAGESAITLDTASLQKGMYIVTVNNGKSATEAAKIVVR